MSRLNFHANLPTILVYSWICSRQDLRAAALPDEQGAGRYKSGQDVIRSLVEAEVALVEAESLHGCLLRLKTSSIDLFTIGATLRENSGIYFNASQEEQRVADQQEEEGRGPESQATEIVIEWLTRDPRLAWPLSVLGETYRDDFASVARVLSLFFQGQSQLALRNRAFFVGECVRLALEQVDWNKVAALLLSPSAGKRAKEPFCDPEICEIDYDPAIPLALFRELLRQAGQELSEWGTRAELARESQELAHFLGDLCRKAAQVEPGPAS